MSERRHPHLTPQQLAYRLWVHPRRTGFIVFNIAILAVIVAFGVLTSSLKGDGLASVPMMILSIGGTTVLIGLWLGVWVAWGIFLLWRHRPHKQPAPPTDPVS